jgi:hypothetical protein
LFIVGSGGHVTTDEIIREIDAEIAKLQQAKMLLIGEPVKRGPGRPAKTAAVEPKRVIQKARKAMSAEARTKIATAKKARWTKSKKAAKG